MTSKYYQKYVNTYIDKFYIESIIGEGAMGVVYLAKDMELDRKVAIKVLKVEVVTSDENMLKRFKQEAQNIAKLNCPNIINIYEVGQTDDLHYIVMEYVDGVKLSDLIFENKLNIDTIIKIMYIVANTILYLHSNDILHRDLKPANIMISKDGIIKLVDFGLSKYVCSSIGISSKGATIGTPVYMSLESFYDSTKATKKSDVFSLGILFYELFCRTLPFLGDTPNEIYRSLLIGIYTEAIELNNNIPLQINVLINKMLKKDEDLRIDVSEVVEILEPYVTIKDDKIVLDTIKEHTDKKEDTEIHKIPTYIVKKEKVSDVIWEEFKNKIWKWFLIGMVIFTFNLLVFLLYILL